MNSDLARIAFGTALALAVPLLTCGGLKAFYPPRDLIQDCRMESLRPDPAGEPASDPRLFNSCFDRVGGYASNARQARTYERVRFVVTTALGLGAVTLGARLAGAIAGPVVPGLVAGGFLTTLLAPARMVRAFRPPGAVVLEGRWTMLTLGAIVSAAAVLGLRHVRANRARQQPGAVPRAAPGLVAVIGVVALLAGALQILLGALGLSTLADLSAEVDFKPLALVPPVGLALCQFLALREAWRFRRSARAGAPTDRHARALLIWHAAGLAVLGLFALGGWLGWQINVHALALAGGSLPPNEILGSDFPLILVYALIPLGSGVVSVVPFLFLSVLLLRPR